MKLHVKARSWQPAVRVFALVLSVSTGLSLAGCAEKREVAKKAELPPPTVVVAPVRVSTVPVVREFVGNVAAYRSVEIRARVEGILQQRHFTEGTDVKTGQLLYSIDPATYVAKLRDAEAQLAQQQATLVNATVKASRLEPLVKEEAISKQDYDDAVAQQKAAEAQVESARAGVETAKLNLGYTKVYATESGRIGTSQIPDGGLVGAGQATLLATIDRIDPIYVNFTMPDRDAIVLRRAMERGEIRVGTGSGTVRFVLPDGSELADIGKIDFQSAQVNRETGTITQRAVLSNPRRVLLPGMFLRVELKVGERPNAILVPQRAVVKVPNGHVAWVVGADHKVERRDLVVGEWLKDDWVIEKGLLAGDRVVIDGVQRVQPGMTVRVADAPVAPSGAPGAGAPAGAQPASGRASSSGGGPSPGAAPSSSAAK